MKQRKLTKDGSAARTATHVETPVLPGLLATEFRQFIEYHPAKDLRRNLRKMLLEFLMHDRSTESIYLKDFLYDIDGLFDLIDAIESNEENAWEPAPTAYSSRKSMSKSK